MSDIDPPRLTFDKSCDDIPCLSQDTRRYFYNNIDGLIEIYGKGKHGAVVTKLYRLPRDKSIRYRRVELCDGNIYVARELSNRNLEISLDINEYLKKPFIVECRRMRLPRIRPLAPKFPRVPMRVNRE